MERRTVSDRVMYYTQLILPALEAYQVDRTIPGSQTPFVAQRTDVYQECLYTILCATLSDADALVKQIQASEWKYDVNVQISIMTEGLGRVSGTISCRRLLPIPTEADVSPSSYAAASYTVTLA